MFSALAAFSKLSISHPHLLASPLKGTVVEVKEIANRQLLIEFVIE
jgi:hypothetical protein